MSEFSRDSYVSAGVDEAAKLVRSTPDATIADVMKSEARKDILDAAFGRLPEIFDAGAASGVQAVVHWAITGAPSGETETHEVVIDNGTCTVSGTPAQQPKVTMTMDAVTYLKIISGGGDPLKLFMMGKVKAKGDMGLAAKFGKYFNIPRG